MYHAPFAGRNTVISDFPSPSKSPATGRSPLSPHAYAAAAVKFVVDFRMYQVPFDGRNTAISARESPSKSPATGMSPLNPQPYEAAAVKLLLDLRMYQAPFAGLNTVTSDFTSPSKSAGGRSLGTTPRSLKIVAAPEKVTTYSSPSASTPNELMLPSGPPALSSADAD